MSETNTEIFPMRVFTCTKFEGYYPVGVAAVVVAKDAEDAACKLSNELCEYGLPQMIQAHQMKELLIVEGNISILNDGNY